MRPLLTPSSMRSSASEAPMDSFEPGDVVVCTFPGARETKRRPAVVLSSALYHEQRPDVILGVLTSMMAEEPGPTDHVLVGWREANLRMPSMFRAFPVALPKTAVVSRVGHLSYRDWSAVRICVTRALALDQTDAEINLGK